MRLNAASGHFSVLRSHVNDAGTALLPASMSNQTFTLIKAPPRDADAVAVAFEALATAIQRRDRCARVEALQRAVDEHPEAFERYCRVVGR